MLLQRLGGGIHSSKWTEHSSIPSTFIRSSHRSNRAKPLSAIKKKLASKVAPFDPVPAWFKEVGKVGEIKVEVKKVLEIKPNHVKVKKLGTLPRGATPVSNAFVIKGQPWLVHYADLFKLDTKSWQFEKVNYTGNLIAQEQAMYDKATNSVIFGRTLDKADFVELSNIQSLDLATMHVSNFPHPQEQMRSVYALTEKGTLLSFGQEPFYIVKDLYLTLQQFVPKLKEWKDVIYDGYRYAPPAARFSWLLTTIGETIYMFANSGRTREEAITWRYTTEATKMERPAVEGVPPTYHEQSTAFQLTLDGRKKIGILGGKRERGGAVSGDLDLLDVESLTWEGKAIVSGDQITPRYGHSSVALNENEVLVFGGKDQEGNNLNEFFLISEEKKQN